MCWQYLRNKKAARRAFTLVELLVVIGIIALLVSILLPALAGARRSAQSIKCASNLRTILHGMQMYVAENQGFFPGGPGSSSRFLFGDDWSPNGQFSEFNCPDVIDVFDWMTPIAHYLNIPFDSGGSTASRVSRYEAFVSDGVFVCPSNDILAGAYTSSGGPNFPITLMPSYNTSLMFQLMPAGTGGSSGVTQAYPTDQCSSPPSYGPKITLVGDASTKIFIADGSRYSGPTIPPDVDLHYLGSLGGGMSDIGAFTSQSHSWDRSHAPGNGGTSGTDARIYAFRHGTQKQNAAAGAYRINAGFFDGHVESLGDLEAANPSLWLPRGSFYSPGGYDKMYADAERAYAAMIGGGIQ